MNKQELVKLFAVAAVAVPGLLLSASIASAQAISADGFPASVPKAICGPGDHTESGLQDETTVQERFSGDSERAYNCNLELVGQQPQGEFEGAYSQDGPAYYGDCAYYGTDNNTPLQQHHGITVIDASEALGEVVRPAVRGEGAHVALAAWHVDARLQNRVAAVGRDVINREIRPTVLAGHEEVAPIIGLHRLVRVKCRGGVG